MRISAFVIKSLTLAAGSLLASLSLAAPVNGSGDLTSNVIFGSGNIDGSFTGVNVNGVELALRAKLRYNLSGQPQNVFNYDGDHTYTFNPANSVAPANRAIFNFEWSINSDSSGSLGRALDDLTYVLTVDVDPGVGVSGPVPYDVINAFTNLLVPDNAMGTNATANGGGVKGTTVTYAGLIASNNVAQNSQNIGFAQYGAANPQAQGTYTFSLAAFDGTNLLAQTSIDVIVGQAAVPVTSTLPLLMSGLSLLALRRRRRA